MKRFNFDLEKILILRKNREKETEIELGKAVGALAELEHRIARIAEEKISASSRRFAKGNSAEDMRNYELFILRLDKTRDVLLEAAARAELAVEEARAVYLEASRERKIIDKLKEKREKEYRKTMQLEEIKVIDDISGGTAARRRLTGE